MTMGEKKTGQEALASLKVALVHDWLYVYAGAERVLAEIMRCIPVSAIYSLIDFLPAEQRDFLQGKTVQVSFLQQLPWAKRLYQRYLPLMPAAIESFDLRDYDVVISTSSAVAKGVLTTPTQLHVCYLQARNLRQLYDERFAYLASGWWRPLQEVLMSRVRVWDAVAAHRPDVTVANSEFVRRWHEHRHGIASRTIYPPVDVQLFGQAYTERKEDYFVTVGRFERYKMIEVVVEAFNRLGRRLVVIGDGSKRLALKRAAGRNVEFTGQLAPREVAKVVGKARAMVYCAREDFGIAPVEAQAAGTPVIGFGEGGLLETVRDLGCEAPTGIFFGAQLPEAIITAVRRFDDAQHLISAMNCRRNAQRFSTERFHREFREFLIEAIDRFHEGPTRLSRVQP
jgi:glycosyltransferase involved in cell wall biosynthesis